MLKNYLKFESLGFEDISNQMNSIIGGMASDWNAICGVNFNWICSDPGKKTPVPTKEPAPTTAQLSRF